MQAFDRALVIRATSFFSVALLASVIHDGYLSAIARSAALVLLLKQTRDIAPRKPVIAKGFDDCIMSDKQHRSSKHISSK